MSDPPPTPNEDVAEPPPLEVDNAFAIGEPSGHMFGHINEPTPAIAKRSIVVLAIALHVVAAIIVAVVLYWKFAQVPAP